MNFSLKLSALFLFISSIAFSQRGKDGIGNINGTSIVNAYTTLSNDVAANTTNTISVANASSFSAGDLVLIIQISGTWANYAAGDTIDPWYDGTSAAPGDTSFGKIMAYNGAGTNEMLQVNSVNSGSNTITFDCQISKSFKASGKTQIVRVPRYSSLDISGTGIITCPHWDRTLGYGGIVALEVQGNTNIASGGRIDASGLGFRGGAFWFKNASAAGSTLWGTTRRNEAGNKGESIAGDTNVYANEASKFGRGAIANGGGGGNSVNAGGGGGANAGLTNKYFGGIGNIDTTTNSNYIQAWTLENTAYPTSGVLSLWRANTNSGGGRGGYTYSLDNDNPLIQGPNNGNWGTSDNRRSVGGYGGRPLAYDNNQLYLGGGGGSGDGENYYQGAGGDGGGIIYFMSYGTITGAGQIVSNGANGSASITNVTRPGDTFSVLGRDGAGGGGGGGAIMINSVGAISGISISATGGNGGNQEMRNNGASTRMAYGPGGGGGGGFVNIPSGNTVTTNTAGGTNGIVTFLGTSNGCLIDDNFPPNGATKGGPGTSIATVTPFYISTIGATICAGNTATITAALNGTAPNPVTIGWFTDSNGGSPFATGSSYTTPVLNSTTDYWVGTCPGTYREKVTVTVNVAPAAPVSTSPINYCLNATASALSATATSSNTIVWYDAASGGNILSQPLTPSTSSVGSTSYFAAQDNGSCVGARTEVVVNIIALPNTPTVTSLVNYCQNETPIAISATVSTGGNSLLYWGTDAIGGTSSGSAPTPSTAAVTSTTYYVSESNGTCESSRVPIVVNVNAIPAAPTTTDTISYCQNQPAIALTPSGATYNWYTTATGGVGTTTAPTPITSAVGTTTYYVSETQNNCESLRDSVKVVVNTSFSAPTALNDTNCIGSTANVLTPNGTGYNWYTASSGGTPSATITPSTVTTGTVSYFVSQGSGTCESSRTQVDVITLALPSTPTLTGSLDICSGNSTTLTISNPTETYNWYTTATGGTSFLSSNTFTTPILTDTTSYYVETFDGQCLSVRNWVRVNVNPIPAAPSTTDTISYCQNQTAIALTPSGANYNWYTTATGGTGTTTAPTPITSTVGVTTYYVSETQNACESLRDSVKVVINTTFAAPTASNANNCFGSSANVLSPNGTGYNWYTSSTGGTASATITPTTNTVGTISYFVSQGSGSCESPRTQVDVTTLALPNKPVGTDVTYCINEPASALNATGAGTLNWYTVSTGGTSSATAPTPLTNAVGNTDYYVSQTDVNTCESTRDTITVSVINLQSAPTTTNVSYCEDATAVALTATGTSQLNWWGTDATGGTSSLTAPTPITTNAGTTTYYVSQGTGACESPRASIVVTVNPKPLLTIIGLNTAGCQSLTSNFLSNAPAGTTVLWNFGDGSTSTTTNVTHTYTTTGTYDVMLTATNSFGCIDSVEMISYVTVYENANAQFTISPSSVIEIGETVSFVGDTSVTQAHNWNFADPASGVLNYASNYNPSHLYSEEGTYCVRLSTITNNGCLDTTEICIQVMGQSFIEIPNVFTPNADGINDLFMVKSSGITNMETNIYDRWGILVYTWNGATGSWDGKNKSGNASSNGVYYYIIKATDFKNVTTDYKGHLQLIDSK